VTAAEGSRVVELEIRLDGPPEEVFPFLIEAERYVLWQGVRAELDPRPGGLFRVWMDEQSVARGEYVRVEPPTLVVFTWGWEGSGDVPPGSTTVELSLRSEGDATVLRLRHSGLPDEAAALLHEEGWKVFTDRLSTAVAGGRPGPMPPAPS
jgi:uncharacterized protein YndB with AHSA1/START domain